MAARIFANATDMVIEKKDRYDFDKLLPQELFAKHEPAPEEVEASE